MDKFITINIFGKPYTFKSDAKSEEAKEAAGILVREVEKTQKELSGQSPAVPKQTIIILAALNIASEYYKLGKKTDLLTNTISQRASRILNALNENST